MQKMKFQQPRTKTIRPRTAVKAAPTSSTFTPGDLAMFAKFKIPSALVEAAHLRRVSNIEARQLPSITAGAGQHLAGLDFPDHDRKTGEIVAHHIRLDFPAKDKKGKLKNKYIGPKADGSPNPLYFPPNAAKKLEDPDCIVVLVEAQKSVLALTAWGVRKNHNILVIGMRGCFGWSQDKAAVPDLDACNRHTVIVLLDANAATSTDVQEARDALVMELQTPVRKCPEVLIGKLPLRDGLNGPDDAIAQPDGDKLIENVLVEAVPTIAMECSDGALAIRLADKHGDDLRHVDAWGRWLRWTGRRWEQLPGTSAVWNLIWAICREVGESAIKATKQRINSAQTVAGVERLARAHDKHMASVDQWDADLMVLNTPGGIVDLRTGKLRPAKREDYCTKITAATPGGDCPLWRKFLNEVTGGNKELQAFLQRMAGYCLTGWAIDHAIFFLYGTGGNGKGTFIETLANLLGDYAHDAPMSTFIVQHNESHPTDRAGLHSARLVTATETEAGRRWDETKLKMLSGGNRVTARFMHKDNFTYTPQFTLVFSGNHRPELRSVDEAIRRRFYLLPFTFRVSDAKKDTHLPEKLKAEWGGILQWAVEGCLAWQRDGLRAPEIVKAATTEYLATEDTLAQWLGEHTVNAKNSRVNSTDLFQAWRGWAEAGNEFVGTQKHFSQSMKDHGFDIGKTRNNAVFIGLRLLRGGESVVDVVGDTELPYRELKTAKKSPSKGVSGLPTTSTTPPPQPGPRFTRAGRGRVTIQ
jgi:P4 family phage/plasmid primase-like protien